MTANGWATYSSIFLAAGVALLLPLGLAAVSVIARWRPNKNLRSEVNTSKVGHREHAIDLRESKVSAAQRMNTRYFLGVNVAMLVSIGLLVLIPLMSFSREREVGAVEILFGALSILACLTWSGLGLAYATQKGDLDWLRSFGDKKGGK